MTPDVTVLQRQQHGIARPKRSRGMTNRPREDLALLRPADRLRGSQRAAMRGLARSVGRAYDLRCIESSAVAAELSPACQLRRKVSSCKLRVKSRMSATKAPDEVEMASRTWVKVHDQEKILRVVNDGSEASNYCQTSSQTHHPPPSRGTSSEDARQRDLRWARSVRSVSRLRRGACVCSLLTSRDIRRKTACSVSVCCSSWWARTCRLTIDF
jgi:hypothetical protein